MTEISLCPFCGGKPFVHGPDNPGHEYWISCQSCQASSVMRSNYDATKEAWNARAPQPVSVAQRPPLTVEDVYANCYTTMIGFARDLKPSDINFICDQISRKVILASPAQPSWQPNTCYLERSAVRSILIGQPDENLHITELVLAEVDALPIVAFGDAADEDHPDCTTTRERELYEALMGLSSAVMARRREWDNWVQGGVKIAPVVRHALRLDASTVPSTEEKSHDSE